MSGHNSLMDWLATQGNRKSVKILLIAKTSVELHFNLDHTFIQSNAWACQALSDHNMSTWMNVLILAIEP